jgi:hypothetical protein
MTYTLSQAANAMAIAEYEYATGPAIQFTAFNSCAGVLAKAAGGGQIIGVHLVAVTNDPAGGAFSAADAATVRARLVALSYDPNSVTVIGQWNCFEQQALAGLGPATFDPPEQGVFGAALVGADIVINEVVAGAVPAAFSAAVVAPVAPPEVPADVQAAQEEAQTVEAADAQIAAQAAQVLAGEAVAGAATDASQQSAAAAQAVAQNADAQAEDNISTYQ